MLVLWLVASDAGAARTSAWIAVRAERDDRRRQARSPSASRSPSARSSTSATAARRTLERPSAGERARVELAANTDARVGDGAIELLTGQARLEGPEARLTGDVAEVTTLGVSAAATVELRRNP